MPIGIMGRKSLALIDWGSRCLPTRAGINTFVCAVSRYVAETPKTSLKDHEPVFPIITLGIIAYGFDEQPFSKQLYTYSS